MIPERVLFIEAAIIVYKFQNIFIAGRDNPTWVERFRVQERWGLMNGV
jgi:hypothetical protein